MISLWQQHTSYQALCVCEVQGRFSNKTMSKWDRYLPQAAGHDGLCYLSPAQLLQTLGCPRSRDQWAIQRPCSRGQPIPLALPNREPAMFNLWDHRVGFMLPASSSSCLHRCAFLLEVTLLAWQPCSRLEFTLMGYSQKTSASVSDLTL